MGSQVGWCWPCLDLWDTEEMLLEDAEALEHFLFETACRPSSFASAHLYILEAINMS